EAAQLGPIAQRLVDQGARRERRQIEIAEVALDGRFDLEQRARQVLVRHHALANQALPDLAPRFPGLAPERALVDRHRAPPERGQAVAAQKGVDFLLPVGQVGTLADREKHDPDRQPMALGQPAAGRETASRWPSGSRRPGAMKRGKQRWSMASWSPAPSPVSSIDPPRCSMQPSAPRASWISSCEGPFRSAIAPTPQPPRPGWRERVAASSSALRPILLSMSIRGLPFQSKSDAARRNKPETFQGQTLRWIEKSANGPIRSKARLRGADWPARWRTESRPECPTACTGWAA